MPWYAHLEAVACASKSMTESQSFLIMMPRVTTNKDTKEDLPRESPLGDIYKTRPWIEVG